LRTSAPRRFTSMRGTSQSSPALSRHRHIAPRKLSSPERAADQVPSRISTPSTNERETNMTTVNAICTSNTFNPYADPNGLTGESLLLYCQTQLNSYDDTISGFLNEQKLNLARKKGLSGIENTLKKYVNHLDQSGVNDIRNTFNSAISALPPGDPVRGAMIDKLAEFNSHSGNGQPIYYTSEQMTAFAGDVRSMLDNVNGNAEINMIQLQQVMSQRQTAVQLTTSLLAKLDEGTKSVVSNIGR
jgi:hypothetical protein